MSLFGEGEPLAVGVDRIYKFTREPNKITFWVEGEVRDKNTKELLEDKFMYFFRAEEPAGDLKPNNEGKFEWVPKSNVIGYIEKPFVTIEEWKSVISMVENFAGEVKFQEYEQFTDDF